MERRWKVLIVVSIAVFVASLDLFIVNIAFPDIRSDFAGSSVAGVSWVLNAYAIVYAALLVPAGRLADRYGRRRGFLAGMVVFLIGSTLCGLAPSVETLVAARVLQAVGAALLTPTSLALLLPEFPPAQRATAIGIWAAVGGVAAAAGPPIGGLLVEVSWRLVFLVNIPVGLAALFYAVRILRETRDETAERPDLIGAGVLAFAIGLLSLGLVEAPDWGWTAPQTLACFAVSALLLGLFWLRCARHPAPMIHLEMLKVRSFSMANLAIMLFMVAFSAMLLGGVLFMTQVWGDTVLKAGLSLSPGPLLAATFSVISGRLVGRLGQRNLATAGCLFFAAGAIWWLTHLTATPDYAAGMFPGLFLTGVGVGLVLPSMSSAAAASLPPSQFATGSAVLTMSRQIGSVLGVSVLVAILDTPSKTDPASTFDGAWILMLVASLAGAVAALAIGTVRMHKLAGEPTTAPDRGSAEPAASVAVAS
jgi:EmrB/QacA subfamily drug resistance transporter